MYSTFLRMIVPDTDTASTMNSVHTEANEAACEPFAELSFWEAVMIATSTSIAAKSCKDKKDHPAATQRTQKAAVSSAEQRKSVVVMNHRFHKMN